MADVIELHPPSANLRCKCGEEWWKSDGIIIEADTGRATGYTFPLTCASCGNRVET